jgi:hypothetical protein
VAQCLLAMSASDANTQNLIAGGLLDVIALALTQSPDAFAERDISTRYDVSSARQSCAAVPSLTLNPPVPPSPTHLPVPVACVCALTRSDCTWPGTRRMS